MSLHYHHIVLYVYNSFKDPLFQGLLLTYLKGMNSENSTFCFHIITYEQKKYALTSTEKLKIAQDLKSSNIYWYPLTYHSGKLLLLKKAWDFMRGFFFVLKLKILTGAKVLLAFTNIAGSIGFVFSRILNLKFVVFSYEPHSEFMADFGLWSRNSLKFKWLNKLEHYMGKHGDYIITGTRHLVSELKLKGAKGQVVRVPSCVDEDKFRFNEASRKIIRSRYNIGNRRCLIYVGKFGDLYYREEIPLLFKLIQRYRSDLFFLVVTPQDTGEIENLFLKSGISKNDFAITYSTYDQVQDYISAGDIGVVAIKPAPSQRFRSPIKTGEYLMCGVPYIVCYGISEDDDYAEQNHVGVVIDDFVKADGKLLMEKMDILLKENPLTLRARCRKVGIEYRGKEQAIELFTQILEGSYDTLTSRFLK